ncbi:hypothetical protein BaOVIS_004580 [Babesia ovis]|uniref:Uncharacterized protein n=1 Tax=Babesia ovis TaxID=5869 RepID=A0A9W5WTR2_BABOV|nr:hypothetical protein BaOVIS_004580 [Babesia ovis]
MIRPSVLLRGPGHSSCKELSVVTQDGPARHFRFRMKPIKHDFGKVLCMADVKTLKKTADEVLRQVLTDKRSMTLPDAWASTGKHSSLQSDSKSPSFWTVFSKRFKASLPIMSADDTVHILRAFHAANKDTGVYVAAAPVMRQTIRDLDKQSLIDALHILSMRLKRNTQQDLFRAMADHIPNVLWKMTAADVAATLWHLSRARCLDSKLAAYVQPKFCDSIDSLNDIELGTAALAFARHGHADARLFNNITTKMSLQCSGEALFRAAWGMHMVGRDIADFLRDRVLTCVEHVQKSERRSTEIWRRMLRHTDCYEKVFGEHEKV